jgi:hypothetical protein
VYAKSISKFPSTADLDDNVLFLISKSMDGSYATYNTKMGDIVNFSKRGILDSVKNEWKLGSVNVGSLNTTVNNFLNNSGRTTTIKSKVTFNQIPEISSTDDLKSNSVVTKSNVE